MAPRRAEVVVVGGGVMGASIAYHLTCRGVRDVLLLERASLCAGPTRRSTAIVRLHYTQPLLIRMAVYGLRMYRTFESAVGAHSGFVRTGMLFGVDPSERSMLEDNVGTGQAEGVETYLIDGEQIAEIDPRIVTDDLVFCYEPEAGHCDPYLVTTGFAAAAARAGARIEEGVRVNRVVDGSVETDDGPIEAAAVVIAAGPWAPQLLSPLGYELEIRPARAEVGRFRLPPGFDPPPAVADFSAAQLYFRPAEPGFLEVGSLDPGHAETPLVDADSCPEAADRESLLAFERALAARLRGAERGYWCGSFSAVYDVSPDWEPVIGPVPGTEHVFVAAGFSGHGFKLAPAVGASLAELVCDGHTTTFDLALLNPLRFERGELVGARYGYSVLG